MENYGRDNLKDKEKPFVEIEDNGDGMSFEIIKNCWMNPASPNKYLKRKKRTRKGRILQGEKGIGRYAVFQIGKKLEIYTRERLGKNKGGREVNLITDLSKYSDELLSEKDETNKNKNLYFDEIK